MHRLVVLAPKVPVNYSWSCRFKVCCVCWLWIVYGVPECEMQFNTLKHIGDCMLHLL